MGQSSGGNKIFLMTKLLMHPGCFLVESFGLVALKRLTAVSQTGFYSEDTCVHIVQCSLSYEQWDKFLSELS